MKTYSKNWKLWIIILLQFKSAFAQENTDVCDETKSCGTGISEALCRSRDCCYIPSNQRVHQCVRKRRVSDQPLHDFAHRQQPPPAEIPPHDAIQLSHQLSQNLDRFASDPNLSPNDALQIANWLEDYLQHVASKGSDINWKFSKDGIFDARIKANPSSFDENVVFDSGTSVRVRPLDKKSWSDISVLIFVQYFTIGSVWSKLDESFAKRIEEKRSRCGSTFRVTESSSVISVKAFDHNRNEKKNSLEVVTAQTKENSEDKKLACSVLNASTEQWSSAKCVSSDNSLACNCKFANATGGFIHSLVTYLEFEESARIFVRIQIVEEIMEGLAVGCLCITFVCLLLNFRRRSKSVTSASARIKERTMVHINFVAAVAALHLTSLVNEVVIMEDLQCKITIIFSQYFTLASAMWMLMECLTLYINITKKKTTHPYLRCIKLLAGWGIPAVLVVIAAAIGTTTGSYAKIKTRDTLCSNDDLHVQEAFSNAPHCSLSTDNHMIWSAVAPLLTIFFANFFMLAHTIGFVMWLNAKSNSLKFSKKKSHGGAYQIWHATKGILVLFPILGLPWLIGYFLLISDYRVNIAFQYAHVISNGLQGVFIFILYCGLNEETQKIFRKDSIKKRRNSKVAKPTATVTKPRNRRKSTGGQANQQPYYFPLQRPRSASFSTNSTHFRWKTKRSYSFTSTDPFNLEGIQTAWSRKSAAGIVGTWSSKSLCADSRPSLIPGLNQQPGEPTMISFSHDEDMLKSQTLPSASKLRWHRVIPKDFKRFSVIPEELRRGGGIESLVIENSDAFSNRKSREIEVQEVEAALNLETVEVDVHMNGRMPRIPPRSQKISKPVSKRDMSAKLKRERFKNVKMRVRDTKVYHVTGRHFDCYKV